MIISTQITSGQTVNACTLISVGVINAICDSANKDQIPSLISKTMVQSQNKYKDMYAGGSQLTLGSGVTVEEALKTNVFNLKTKETIRLSATNLIDDIHTFIANRQGYTQDQIMSDFYAFNLDLIERLTGEITDFSVFMPESELRTLANATQQTISLAMEPQLQTAIENLQNREGFTLTYGAHTISVAKNHDVFYSFDSQTGSLLETNIASELSKKIFSDKIEPNRSSEVELTQLEIATPTLSQTSTSMPIHSQSIFRQTYFELIDELQEEINHHSAETSALLDVTNLINLLKGIGNDYFDSDSLVLTISNQLEKFQTFQHNNNQVIENIKDQLQPYSIWNQILSILNKIIHVCKKIANNIFSNAQPNSHATDTNCFFTIKEPQMISDLTVFQTKLNEQVITPIQSNLDNASSVFSF